MMQAGDIDDHWAAARRSNPETGAGGFSKVDGTVEFFSRVQAVLPDKGIVVDLGAGRGKWQEDPCRWRQRLCQLRYNTRSVIGVDVDRAVSQNTGVDAAVLAGRDGMLPFRAGSLTAVVADWVFEHLPDPATTARELARTVGPGGWVCARTPTRWGYIGLGARLVPNEHHVRLLRRLQPERKASDVFAVQYRLNTRSAIRRAFPPELWRDYSYTYNPDPSYFGRSTMGLFLLGAWQRVAPQALAATWHIFLQRREV